MDPERLANEISMRKNDISGTISPKIEIVDEDLEAYQTSQWVENKANKR